MPRHLVAATTGEDGNSPSPPPPIFAGVPLIGGPLLELYRERILRNTVPGFSSEVQAVNVCGHDVRGQEIMSLV